MTFYVPRAIAVDSDNESSNLAAPVTPMPVALTLADGFVPLLTSAYGTDPAPLPEFREPGVLLRTSMRDWYYRIHVTPARLDLGNLAGDTQREVVVWNAFFEPVTLEGFVLNADAGVTVESEVSPPQSLPPLEEVSYFFNISANGPATIDGSATWTIDGVEYTVPITGSRTVLFSFRPDWRLGPVEETLEWKNTVTVSYDGRNEQVVAARKQPRRSIDYRVRLREDDARLFDLAVFGWTGRVFGLPLWHEKVKTQSDAPQGGQVLAIDTTHSSFVEGGTAVLFRTATEFELLDIESVTEDGITIANSLSRPWATGSTVIPVLPAIPNSRFSTTRAVPRHLDTSADFTILPQASVLRLPESEPEMVYRGYEVYTKETNWRAGIAVDFNARRILVDGGLGAMRVQPKTSFPERTRTMSWLCKNREAADDLRAFFARRKGRRVPVWMPSGTDDFIMTEPSALGETSLYVKRSSYNALVANNAAQRDIILVMRNGDRLARRIMLVEANDGGGSTITIDSGLPYAMGPGDVKRISFLHFSRLDRDSVTFAWATATVAEVAVTFALKEAP